jgi:hypothetical protein
MRAPALLAAVMCAGCAEPAALTAVTVCVMEEQADVEDDGEDGDVVPGSELIDEIDARVVFGDEARLSGAREHERCGSGAFFTFEMEYADGRHGRVSIGTRADEPRRHTAPDVTLPESEALRARLWYSDGWHTLARVALSDDDGPLLLAAQNAPAADEEGDVTTKAGGLAQAPRFGTCGMSSSYVLDFAAGDAQLSLAPYETGALAVRDVALAVSHVETSEQLALCTDGLGGQHTTWIATRAD